MLTRRLALLLLLLALTLACHKDKGLPPDGLTDDPSGLPLPPASCRIVKETVKILMEPSDKWPDRETITLPDGQKVLVGKIYTADHYYDDKGRVSKVTTTGQESINTDIYVYSPDRLTTQMINRRKDGTTPALNLTTYAPLDSLGLMAGSYINGQGPEQNSWYEYDEKNRLIRTLTTKGTQRRILFEQNIYEGDNLVRQYWIGAYASNDTLTRQYTYDSRRPNLPVMYTFRGQQSRSLPQRILLTSRGNAFGDEPLYETRYYYRYDRQGRVRRRVAVGRQLNPQYLIDENFGTINVRDYEYDCP